MIITEATVKARAIAPRHAPISTNRSIQDRAGDNVAYWITRLHEDIKMFRELGQVKTACMYANFIQTDIDMLITWIKFLMRNYGEQ